MSEIRKLSLDSSINSFASQSFGSCTVKEEIDKLSARWKHLDAQFNDQHNEILKKKETITSKLTGEDDNSQNNIYLESIPIMETRLRDLKSQKAEPSNFADISTNMNITKLAGLIENYGSFEILRQNSLSWINDTNAGIHRAKQNINRMAEKSIIDQDEEFLTNLLKVLLLEFSL